MDDKERTERENKLNQLLKNLKNKDESIISLAFRIGWNISNRYSNKKGSYKTIT